MRWQSGDCNRLGTRTSVDAMLMPPCLMFAKEPCGKYWTLEQEGGSVNWMYLQHSHSRFGCVPTSHGSYRRNVSSTFANGTASAFAIMDRNVYSVGSLGETSSSSLVFRRIGDGIFFCTNSLTFYISSIYYPTHIEQVCLHWQGHPQGQGHQALHCP